MIDLHKLSFCDLLDDYLELRDLDRCSDDSRPISKRSADRLRAQEIRLELNLRVERAQPG